MYATTFIVVLILLLGSAVLVGPRTGEAQRAVKIVRIGLLEAASAAGYAKGHEALSAGLRDLGYVEGKNIVVEYRWGEGNYERLPGLAVELVQMNVDVIVAGGFQAISAAQSLPGLSRALPGPEETSQAYPTSTSML